MILDTKGNKFNNERNNFNTKMDSIKNNAQIVDEANLNPFVEDVNSTSYADPTKALKEIGFKAKYGIEEMMEDHWRFQKNLYIK